MGAKGVEARPGRDRCKHPGMKGQARMYTLKRIAERAERRPGSVTNVWNNGTLTRSDNIEHDNNVKAIKCYGLKGWQ